MAVEIYTDGSCLENPGGAGGWAALIVADGTETELAGSEPATTNNRMELRAALEAMRTLADGTEANIFTDSQYLKQGITEWILAWKRKGWKRSKGSVKNLDLWHELDRNNERLDLSWNWVRSHSGQPQNERVDQLARQAAMALASRKVLEESSRTSELKQTDLHHYVAVCVARPSKNDEPGSWYVRIRDPDGHVQVWSQTESQESVQVLELMGATKAIEAVPSGCALRFRTSSNYLVSGITESVARWQSEGWKDLDGNEILYKDRWLRLIGACASRNIEWELLRELEEVLWGYKAECGISGGPLQTAGGPS